MRGNQPDIFSHDGRGRRERGFVAGNYHMKISPKRNRKPRAERKPPVRDGIPKWMSVGIVGIVVVVWTGGLAGLAGLQFYASRMVPAILFGGLGVLLIGNMVHNWRDYGWVFLPVLGELPRQKNPFGYWLVVGILVACGVAAVVVGILFAAGVFSWRVEA